MTEYNVRVYGLLIKEGKILVEKVHYGEHIFIKFPGGGMEDGEGTIETLKREFQEEMMVEIQVLNHFYTTDFYQKSMFDDKQVLSIYYTLLLLGDLDFPLKNERSEFYFVKLDEDLEKMLSLPIDKVVGKTIRSSI